MIYLFHTFSTQPISTPTFSSKGDPLGTLRMVALRQGPRRAVQVVAHPAAVVRRLRRPPFRHRGEGGAEGRGTRLGGAKCTRGLIDSEFENCSCFCKIDALQNWFIFLYIVEACKHVPIILHWG